MSRIVLLEMDIVEKIQFAVLNHIQWKVNIQFRDLKIHGNGTAMAGGRILPADVEIKSRLEQFFRIKLIQLIQSKQCNRCQGFGHITANCDRHNRSICMRCGKQGHTTRL